MKKKAPTKRVRRKSGSRVTFTSRLTAASTPLNHVWEHTVGSGHAVLALRADWQAQMQRCHDELGFRHVRFHGLFDDDMGTLISHLDELAALPAPGGARRCPTPFRFLCARWHRSPAQHEGCQRARGK